MNKLNIEKIKTKEDLAMFLSSDKVMNHTNQIYIWVMLGMIFHMVWGKGDTIIVISLSLMVLYSLMIIASQTYLLFKNK
jgi:hypothetical protein